MARLAFISRHAPTAALRLCSEFLVGVFENDNRAPAGAPPQFAAKALHVYDMRD